MGGRGRGRNTPDEGQVHGKKPSRRRGRGRIRTPAEGAAEQPISGRGRGTKRKKQAHANTTDANTSGRSTRRGAYYLLFGDDG